MRLRPGPAFPPRLAAAVIIGLLLWLLAAVVAGNPASPTTPPTPAPTSTSATSTTTGAGYTPTPAGPPATDQRGQWTADPAQPDPSVGGGR
jgi:hypothetical protein